MAVGRPETKGPPGQDPPGDRASRDAARPLIVRPPSSCPAPTVSLPIDGRPWLCVLLVGRAHSQSSDPLNPIVPSGGWTPSLPPNHLPPFPSPHYHFRYFPQPTAPQPRQGQRDDWSPGHCTAQRCGWGIDEGGRSLHAWLVNWFVK